MRLWHKDLIPYLPRLQLIAQWRECCAICSNCVNKGTPNHILVNKVVNYKPVQFLKYTWFVREEILKKGYKISEQSESHFISYIHKIANECGRESSCFIFLMEYYKTHQINLNDVFEGWHNERYLKQCLINLQEKYDCGGISENEWKIIENKFGKYL